MSKNEKIEYAYRLILPKELEKQIKQFCLEKDIKIKDFILNAILRELKNEK